MVGWDHLVEIERIEELDLTILPPTHHAPLPLMPVSNNGITVCKSPQRVFCNTILTKAALRVHRFPVLPSVLPHQHPHRGIAQQVRGVPDQSSFVLREAAGRHTKLATEQSRGMSGDAP